MARIFVSYKHHAEPDERLANYFVHALQQLGHRIFIDRRIAIGDEWPAVIQAELQAADYLLLLLSSESAVSDMVIQEVKIARDVRRRRLAQKKSGRPMILPVRLAYVGDPPYDLAAAISRVQQAYWRNEGDEAAILDQLSDAMARGRSPRVARAASSPATTLATDGNQAASDDAIAPPLPAFDPKWLEELDAPGGTVRLESPFYVERDQDERSKLLILRDGVTLRLKGSRQMGKSSLMARLHQYARDHQLGTLYIDFQSLDAGQFQSLDTILRALADLLALKFTTNQSPDRYWQTPLGVKDKLSQFLSNEILERADKPLVLLLDEVDRLFAFDNYRDDFFSLIRSWHNRRAIDPLWRKLNLVLSYSTEAFMFIADLNQSPFNVGEDLMLEDFSRGQVDALNQQHGTPIQAAHELTRLIELLGGHPFLIRKALYELVARRTSPDQLFARALDDDGPFVEHLHRYLWWLLDHPDLRTAMLSVVRQQSCGNDQLFYRLRAAGLVRGTQRLNLQPRCGLYAQYFGRHL